MKLRYLSILFSFLTIYQAYAGLGSPKKQPKTFFTQDNCGLETVLQSLEKTANDDVIYGDFFAFSDQKLANILKRKVNEGVAVHLNVCASQNNNKMINFLKKNEIPYTIFNEYKKRETGDFPQTLHKKCLLWTFTDPETGQLQYRSWHGSRNATHLANQNQEVMIYDNDPSIFRKLIDWHKYTQSLPLTSTPNTPPKQINYNNNPVQEITPKKNSILSSHEVNLCGTVARRINNTKNGDAIYANMYSCDHPEVQKALLASAQKKVLKQVVIDGGALKKSINFLQQLSNNGVPVSVFNPEPAQGKLYQYSTQNHIKGILRKKENGEVLSILGSTNFTQKNNNDLNNLAEYVEKSIFDESLAAFNTICHQSKSLDIALQIAGMQSEQPKAKRKLDMSSFETKKQKTDNNLSENNHAMAIKAVVKKAQEQGKNKTLTSNQINSYRNELFKFTNNTDREIQNRYVGATKTLDFLENHYLNKLGNT